VIRRTIRIDRKLHDTLKEHLFFPLRDEDIFRILLEMDETLYDSVQSNEV